MSDVYATLEEATSALATTAERAAVLIRTESARAREEAGRTRRELDELRDELRAARAEFDTVRASVARQEDDRERVRRSAGWAWSAVGLMAACIIIAVGWTATQLTRGHAVVASLNDNVSQLQQTIQNRETQLAELQTQLRTARVAQARAEVEARLLSSDLAKAALWREASLFKLDLNPTSVSPSPPPLAEPVTAIDPEEPLADFESP